MASTVGSEGIAGAAKPKRVRRPNHRRPKVLPVTVRQRLATLGHNPRNNETSDVNLGELVEQLTRDIQQYTMAANHWQSKLLALQSGKMEAEEGEEGREEGEEVGEGEEVLIEEVAERELWQRMKRAVNPSLEVMEVGMPRVRGVGLTNVESESCFITILENITSLANMFGLFEAKEGRWSAIYRLKPDFSEERARQVWGDVFNPIDARADAFHWDSGPSSRRFDRKDRHGALESRRRLIGMGKDDGKSNTLNNNKSSAFPFSSSSSSYHLSSYQSNSSSSSTTSSSNINPSPYDLENDDDIDHMDVILSASSDFDIVDMLHYCSLLLVGFNQAIFDDVAHTKARDHLGKQVERLLREAIFTRNIGSNKEHAHGLLAGILGVLRHFSGLSRAGAVVSLLEIAWATCMQHVENIHPIMKGVVSFVSTVLAPSQSRRAVWMARNQENFVSTQERYFHLTTTAYFTASYYALTTRDEDALLHYLAQLDDILAPSAAFLQKVANHTSLASGSSKPSSVERAESSTNPTSTSGAATLPSAAETGSEIAGPYFQDPSTCWHLASQQNSSSSKSYGLPCTLSHHPSVYPATTIAKNNNPFSPSSTSSNSSSSVSSPTPSTNDEGVMFAASRMPTNTHHPIQTCTSSTAPTHGPWKAPPTPYVWASARMTGYGKEGSATTVNNSVSEELQTNPPFSIINTSAPNAYGLLQIPAYHAVTNERPNTARQYATGETTAEDWTFSSGPEPFHPPHDSFSTTHIHHQGDMDQFQHLGHATQTMEEDASSSFFLLKSSSDLLKSSSDFVFGTGQAQIQVAGEGVCCEEALNLEPHHQIQDFQSSTRRDPQSEWVSSNHHMMMPTNTSSSDGTGHERHDSYQHPHEIPNACPPFPVLSPAMDESSSSSSTQSWNSYPAHSEPGKEYLPNEDFKSCLRAASHLIRAEAALLTSDYPTCRMWVDEAEKEMNLVPDVYLHHKIFLVDVSVLKQVFGTTCPFPSGNYSVPEEFERRIKAESERRRAKFPPSSSYGIRGTPSSNSKS